MQLLFSEVLEELNWSTISYSKKDVSTRISKENAMTTWARIKYQGEGTHSYTGTVTHVCLYLNTNNAQTWNVVPFTILCNGTGHR